MVVKLENVLDMDRMQRNDIDLSIRVSPHCAVPGARWRPTCGWWDDLATSNLLRCGGGQKEVISTKSLCNFCVNY